MMYVVELHDGMGRLERLLIDAKDDKDANDRIIELNLKLLPGLDFEFLPPVRLEP